MTTTTTDRAEERIKRLVAITLGVSFASVKTADSLARERSDG